MCICEQWTGYNANRINFNSFDTQTNRQTYTHTHTHKHHQPHWSMKYITANAFLLRVVQPNYTGHIPIIQSILLINHSIANEMQTNNDFNGPNYPSNTCSYINLHFKWLRVTRPTWFVLQEYCSTNERTALSHINIKRMQSWYISWIWMQFLHSHKLNYISLDSH